MVFTWVAVALVLGLLIGFVTLSIVWTARSTSKSIRERSLELLSAYDELLEQRSRKLAALDAALEYREKELAKQPEQTPKPIPVAEKPSADPTALLKAAEQLATTPYQNSGAGEAYQRIRQTFAGISDETVRQLVSRSRSDSSKGSASALLELLPFDTIYQLSTLSGKEQLQLLYDTVPESMRWIISDYAAHMTRFDSIAFYDMLKATAAEESRSARLRVAPQDMKNYPASLDVTVDEDICEGFQVELDNILYDYAIKTGEIG